MAVKKEQIFAAADALAAEGLRPTLESIRQITGGSYSTISPALNEWKARQAAKASPIREAAPQAVADRMAEVGAEIWAIALEMANRDETQPPPASRPLCYGESSTHLSELWRNKKVPLLLSHKVVPCTTQCAILTPVAQ